MGLKSYVQGGPGGKARRRAIARGVRQGILPPEFTEVKPRRVLRGKQASPKQKRYIRTTAKQIKAVRRRKTQQ